MRGLRGRSPEQNATATGRSGGTSVKAQTPWAAVVVIAGLLAIVAVFVVAVLTYDVAADVATAVSPVTGVIAAIVGAYFGIRGASIAQGQAMEMLMASTTTPASQTNGDEGQTPANGPTGNAPPKGSDPGDKA